MSRWRTRSGKRRLAIAAAIVLAAGLFAPSRASAVAIDGASVLVAKSVFIDPAAGGNIGGFTYDAANDAFYIDIFGGTSGIRKVTRTTPGGDWTVTDYVNSGTTAEPSDLRRFYLSSDVAGGQVSTTTTGTPIPASILLNPTALTLKVKAPANYTESFGYGPVDANGNISVTYAPGSLAFITETGGTVKQNGTTSRTDWTKKVYRWDLRAVGAATTVQPDYNTGTSGSAANPNPGGLYGAYGQTDWNDTFSNALSEQALRQAYADYQATHPGAAAWASTSVSNFGRQFAWATNGQSLYAVEHNAVAGGVYKISATEGTAKLIYSEPGTSGANNVIAEPAVLPTTRRDLGAGFGAGDQILFDGTVANGNQGGISYVVDNGTSTSERKTLVSGDTFRNYSELASGGSVTSLTTDSQGNVYFYESQTHELHKYDTQGRLSVVLNKAQLYEINETQGMGRGDSGGMLRLQVHEDASGTHILYRGNNSYIGTVQVYDTGDFNHDNQINQTDKNFFITQYNKTFHGNAPLAVGTNGVTINDYVDYIAADVNGSSQPTPNAITGAAGLSAASVTYKDLLVLKQFIPLSLGDLNWDGTALDSADWAIFNSHLDIAANTLGFTNYSWFDGDINGDGVVNSSDYLRLALPGDLDGDAFVGASDLSVLQSAWGQHVNPWTNGDIDGDGFIGASDLSILQGDWGQHASLSGLGAGLGLGIQAVPEPSSFAMCGLVGLIMAAFVARKRRSGKAAA